MSHENVRNTKSKARRIENSAGQSVIEERDCFSISGLEDVEPAAPYQPSGGYSFELGNSNGDEPLLSFADAALLDDSGEQDFEDSDWQGSGPDSDPASLVDPTSPCSDAEDEDDEDDQPVAMSGVLEVLSPLTDAEMQVGVGYETIVITPSDAAKLWDASAWGGQRDKRMKHIKHLATEMMDGRWVPNAAPLQFAFFQDVVYCVNGQGRLHAVILSKTAQQFLVIKHFCKTEQDIKDLYKAIDRNLPRRLRDTIKVEKYDVEDVLKIVEYEKVGTAIRSLLEGGDGVSSRTSAPIPDAVMMHLLDRLVQPARVYLDAITHAVGKDRQGKPKTQVNRKFLAGPMMQIGILAAIADPARCTEFFAKASQSFDHSKGDPAAALFQWLQTNRVDDTRTGAYARVVAQCWNAFYDGKRLDEPTSKSVIGHAGPFRVAGSAFHGKRRMVLNPSLEPDAPLFIAG